LPILINQSVEAELVVQDAASYERIFDLAERLDTMQAVKEGLASVDRGKANDESVGSDPSAHCIAVRMGLCSLTSQFPAG
jgi:hypothetical protein